jgi:MFS transporter, FHS family, glucose/mannose:H+ symporter
MSTPAVLVSATSRQQVLFAILFTGFILTGIAISVLGPILPVFIARWALDDAKAGLFSTVAFGTSLGGVFLSSAANNYFGYRPSIVSGYLLMSLGLVGLNSSSLTFALVSAAAIGLGYGMAVPATNLRVAEMGGAKNAGLVSLVNLAWGLGALSCSPILMLSLKLHALPQMLIGVATLGIVLMLALLFVAMPGEKRTETVASGTTAVPQLGLWVAAGLASLFFIYVGTEVSFSFWAATYAKRLAAGAVEMSTVAPMFFFGGLMSGRALTPALLNRIREGKLALGALCVVLVGGALLVTFSMQTMAFISLVVAGLGCACIFPILVAWLSRWYGSRAKRISALMFSMASVGGSAVPWVVGYISDHAGGLRIGLLLPLINALAMMLLMVLLRRQTSAG